MIVCECGHGIGVHNYKCRGRADKHIYPAQCSCMLSWEAVEARYWARKMMAERDELQKDLDRIANPTVEILRDEFSLSQPPGGVLGFWMQGLTQMFIDQGAKNYIEILLRNAASSSDPTEYIFHIQKKDGKTPHELRLEAETERDALQKERDDFHHDANILLVERDALQAKVHELETATYCAYCGEMFLLDDKAATLVTEHINTCQKHPMRKVESERDALKAKLDEARETLEYVLPFFILPIDHDAYQKVKDALAYLDAIPNTGGRE